MDDEVPLVIGGRLPVDESAHRAGEPDLLVRSDAFPRARDGGYLPVDVKHHGATCKQRRTPDGVLTSKLDTLFLGPAVLDPGWSPSGCGPICCSWPTTNACSRRAGTPLGWGGGPASWPRGAARLVRPRPAQVAALRVHRGSAGWPLSTVELYDLEFAYRLSVIDASLVHVRSGVAAPGRADRRKGVRRVWLAGLVLERMEASGELSLLPGMTVAKRRKYLARGVTTLDELASRTPSPPGSLRRESMWPSSKRRRGTADPSTPVTDLMAGRPKQADDRWKKVSTPSPMRPPRSVDGTLRRCGPNDLPQQIDNARARIGPSPAYRRRGRAGHSAPGRHRGGRGHGEREQGLLPLGHPAQRPWCAGPESSTFVPFASWNPDIGVGELEAFLAFWEWFSDLRREAERRGVTFCADCYSQAAENGRLAPGRALRLEDEVDDFIRSSNGSTCSRS